MNDDPMDSIPSFDRVSIRAVLVNDGEDPGPALSEAGILDPVALPVMFEDDFGSSGGFLGDGFTPNLKAVLEPDQQEDDEASFAAPAVRSARPEQVRETSSRSVTATLPPAFGTKPLAPIRRRGG